MVLHVHSDASYLSEPEAKSRVGGYHFLGDKDNPDPNSEPSTSERSSTRRMQHPPQRHVLRQQKPKQEHSL